MGCPRSFGAVGRCRNSNEVIRIPKIVRVLPFFVFAPESAAGVVRGTQGDHVVNVKFGGVREGRPCVGVPPEAAQDLAALLCLELDGLLGFRNEDLLSRVLTILVSVDPVAPISTIVVWKGFAEPHCHTEDSQSSNEED